MSEDQYKSCEEVTQRPAGFFPLLVFYYYKTCKTISLIPAFFEVSMYSPSLDSKFFVKT